MTLRTLDLCTGGGGEALGIEQAGFATAGAVEIDPVACRTLRHNRPDWQVIEADLRDVELSLAAQAAEMMNTFRRAQRTAAWYEEGILPKARETVEVTEQEVGTLVCCDSSGKCYCQGLLIQVRADVHQSARADMPLKHV